MNIKPDKSAVCHEIAENVQANRQICTIHALCYRFLKEYYKEWRGLELAPEWWIKKTVLELLEKYFKNASNRPAYEETRDVIFTSKFHGFSSEDCGAFFSNVMEEYYAEKITSIRQEFDRKLVENHYMTFSDQLLSMELGLRNDPNFKSFCQAKFNYLIVDEGQDTSKQAMTILSSLIDHTNNIFIVGDTDQLLYRFTGASPEFNMTDGFEMRYPNGLTFNLETNYRSTNAIVETSLKSIRNNYSDYDGPYDVRYMKKLVAATSEKGMPITFKSFADPVEEAKGIAQDISADLQNGRKPDDYFIGFRTRAQAGYLEAVFAFTDIPYVNTTGVSFWSLKHIQALLSYLKLANNIGDSSDFENVFNVPSRLFTVPWRSHPDYGTYCNHRFLGRQFVAECNSDISRLRRMTTIPKYAPGAVDFLMILNELTSLEDPREAVTYLIDEVFRKYLNFETGNSENNVGEGTKIDDLATVVEVAGMFSNISDFIQYVNKMVESSKANIEGDWTGKVVFSTIHRLKGLERPVVFGVGICEGSAMTTPPVGLLPHTFSIADPPSTGKLNLSGRGRVEDERCLFYVLITRAKQEVHLSYPVTYRKSLMRPSRFIDEIGLGKILELPGDR